MIFFHPSKNNISRDISAIPIVISWYLFELELLAELSFAEAFRKYSLPAITFSYKNIKTKTVIYFFF